jgi:hypothetical protein
MRFPSFMLTRFPTLPMFAPVPVGPALPECWRRHLWEDERFLARSCPGS